jgi:hypothetical protein
LFPALKFHLGGYKFGDKREANRVEALWLLREERYWCQQGIEKLAHPVINTSVVVVVVQRCN